MQTKRVRTLPAVSELNDYKTSAVCFQADRLRLLFEPSDSLNNQVFSVFFLIWKAVHPDKYQINYK